MMTKNSNDLGGSQEHHNKEHEHKDEDVLNRHSKATQERHDFGGSQEHHSNEHEHTNDDVQKRHSIATQEHQSSHPSHQHNDVQKAHQFESTTATIAIDTDNDNQEQEHSNTSQLHSNTSNRYYDFEAEKRETRIQQHKKQTQEDLANELRELDRIRLQERIAEKRRRKLEKAAGNPA